MRAISFAMLILASTAFATPLPPVKGESVQWDSQWGLVSVSGRAVTVEGNPFWTGYGEVRKDGMVLIHWKNGDTKWAIGLYRAIEDGLQGNWGWVENVEIDERGDICDVSGSGLMGETLRKK